MKSGLPTIIVSVTALLSMPLSVSAQLDTAVSNALGAKLDEYMLIIGTEPAEVKCEETDFLISSCTDSLVRQFTALRLYSHFMESKLMGDESVAIHIFDKWFSDGKVKMKSESDFMGARIFAEFNRQSLIGKKAPELYLENDSGAYVSIFGNDSRSDRPSILFFYDSGCATCKMESIMLRSLLNGTEYTVNLYAVYTQQSGENMERFKTEYLDIRNPQVNVEYLWDPMSVSDFQMKYGILQTPGIFLISRNGTVIGRKLDVMALGRLMEIYCKPYEYGSRESSAFYDEVFASYGGHPGSDDVKGICDAIAGKTLEQKDTLRFKQMAGDLLYYLSGKREQAFKCGTEYLVRNLILGRDDIWDTADDTLKIVQFAEISDELLGRAAIGSKVPDIRLHATLKTAGKTRQGEFRLGRLHRETVIIFHTEGCAICKAELAAADSLLAKMDKRQRNTAVLLVDMDEILVSYPAIAEQLFNTFDLTSLPYIIRIDRKGTVIGKYISLI